jgi:hypothetical protein
MNINNMHPYLAQYVRIYQIQKSVATLTTFCFFCFVFVLISFFSFSVWFSYLKYRAQVHDISARIMLIINATQVFVLIGSLT